MSTSVYKPPIFIGAFLYLALLLPFATGQQIFEGLCRKPSGLWKGPCFRRHHCDSQCREKEGGLGGNCSGLECWCRFKYCGTTCHKLSGLWRGPCFHSDHCKQLCTEKEKQIWGVCEWFQCYCRVHC